MSGCFLIAPVYIEALHVQGKSGYLAVEPMANFRNLPYCDHDYDSTPGLRKNNPNASGQDVLSGTPYISEKVVSQPFQNRNLLLSPGIHLHWNLPKALRTGEAKEEGLSFPTAPNRWLVIRSRRETIEQQWIVESDYLWPIIPDTEKIQKTPTSICIPYPPNPEQGKNQPFRYLGRQLSLADWLKDDQKEREYWGESLTAIGYGEPAFAAFYPNCYSVFGCRDTEPGDLNSNLSYEVIGWHSKIEFDYIRALIPQYSSQSDCSFKDWLQDKIRWNLDQNIEGIQASLQTLYYGCLEFKQNNRDRASDNQPELDSVVLANSGTEALSTYIAHQIAKNDGNLSKLDLENQLEAIQLLSSLEQEQDDLENKLREARHEKEFISDSSGIVWTIEKIDGNQSNYLEKENSEKSLLDLPEDFADKLKTLNKLQQDYNTIECELESERQQLFADWYKYLICLYPPLDDFDRYPRPELIRDFITSKIGLLKPKQTESENLKTQIEQDLTDLKNNLDQLNDSLKERAAKQSSNTKPQEYQLKSLPAPRYWQPNEPVVMAVFKSQEKTASAAETATTVEPNFLNCFILELEDGQTGKSLFNESLAMRLRESVQKLDRKDQFIQAWRSQHWKPFLLEWEAQVTGIREQRQYLNNFMERYYQPDQDGIDYQLQQFYSTLTREGQKNVYNGRSYLSDHAADQHKQQIESFFTRKDFFHQFCQERAIASERGWLERNLVALQEWIANSPIQEPKKQFFTQLLNIYESFNHLQCVSQCLNGFNQALLGRKQTLQLSIDDPIGFEQNRPFVELVRDTIQNSIISAPQPLNFFNPIRSGSLKISRLRVVDTFGRVRDLEWEQTLTPEHLKKVGKDNAIDLPPRLVQPARLHFRWLSSNSDHTQEEAGSHPSLNPICGWIVPDRLDGTLEIYNAEGYSLGELEIEQAGSDRWRPAPGSKFSVASVEEIPNPHLKRVVCYLNKQNNNQKDNQNNQNKQNDDFLEEFVQSISEACEQIEPATTNPNPSLTLMMGQPIAVVRATLNLQLQGLPAINQDWVVFKRESQQFRKNPHEFLERETNNFTNVQFPIYLGNSQRLSDGLVGYWQEIHAQDEIFLSQEVYIPLKPTSEPKNQSQKIQAQDQMSLEEDVHSPFELKPESKNQSKRIIKQRRPLYQTVRSKPLFFTALIDPRGSVQAISRILPSKCISIPTEHYVNILNNFSITFLVAPMLSYNKIGIPLVEASNYRWSWLEKESSEQWLEISEVGQITRDRFINDFPRLDPNLSSEQIWDYLRNEKVGWFKLGNDGIKYWVIPPEKRAVKKIEKPYDALQKKIEILLDCLVDKVRPTTVEATFFPQEIREGWLKLQRGS